ncbi:MAG: hypothetical protein P8J33_17100, partial [Pirellulaceae bacterium]|nr:hypothetical protein [Pirellulaceae bacterium]
IQTSITSFATSPFLPRTAFSVEISYGRFQPKARFPSAVIAPASLPMYHGSTPTKNISAGVDKSQ